jgi:glycosyltransferase involved in cell wall biosynthesis
MIRIGIDASNIGVAGGATHLVEILRHLDLSNHDIGHVVVWGRQDLLDRIESRDWLELLNPSLLEHSLLYRLYWQQYRLAKEAEHRCDVLFILGGLYFGAFRPYVTMMQNMLPFDTRERARYGISKDRLRLHLLEWGQQQTFKRAEGVIFLTHTAQNRFEKRHGTIDGRTTVIPHGVSKEFESGPIVDRRHELSPTDEASFRWLYVSPVRLYKHQWHVVQATAMLREQGYPVELDLVGGLGTGEEELRSAMSKVDPDQEFIQVRGRVPHRKISKLYKSADSFVFASTCETFGQVLTEAMQAGLPIACSHQSAAPEVVQDAGVYFDPENPADIAEAMAKLMDEDELRREKSRAACKRAKRFSWERCAHETFNFVSDIKK